jgi:hypothetical protein
MQKSHIPDESGRQRAGSARAAPATALGPWSSPLSPAPVGDTCGRPSYNQQGSPAAPGVSIRRTRRPGGPHSQEDPGQPTDLPDLPASGHKQRDQREQWRPRPRCASGQQVPKGRLPFPSGRSLSTAPHGPIAARAGSACPDPVPVSGADCRRSAMGVHATVMEFRLFVNVEPDRPVFRDEALGHLRQRMAGRRPVDHADGGVEAVSTAHAPVLPGSNEATMNPRASGSGWGWVGQVRTRASGTGP